jgi:FkbM family methyltransferase
LKRSEVNGAPWGAVLGVDLTLFYKHLPRFVFFINRVTNANYEEEMRVLGVLCDPARTSIDVGAKVGMYLVRLLPVSKKVIGFEPIPELGRLLRTVFAKAPNLDVKEAAVSSRPGAATIRFPMFWFGFPKYGRGTIEPDNRLDFSKAREIRAFQVKVETLDQHRAESVGFIKIDVEGHELEVLRGTKEILMRDLPTLVIEAQECLIKNSVNGVATFLKSFGYRGFFIDGPRLLPVWDFKTEAFPRVKNFIYLHPKGKVSPGAVEKHLAG